MRFALFLLFVIVPLVETALLMMLAYWLGPSTGFLVVLLTGIVGATLAKREGLGVLRALQADLQRGLPPGDRLTEGVLVLVGGLLLITPGVLTDVTGMLLVISPTRRRIAPRVLAILKSAVEVHPTQSSLHPTPLPDKDPFSSPFDDLP